VVFIEGVAISGAGTAVVKIATMVIRLVPNYVRSCIGFESAMRHPDTISSSERETRTPRCARRELLHPPKER